MLFTCAITGRQISAQDFPMVHAKMVHPFLQQPIHKLNRISHKELSLQETELMLAAYLAAIPQITFRAPIQFSQVPPLKLRQYLWLATQVANWIDSLTAKERESKAYKLPEYAITQANANLDGLKTYLEIVLSWRDFGNYVREGSSKTEWELGEEIREAREKALLYRRASQQQDFTVILDWACKYLFDVCPKFSKDSENTLRKICLGKDVALAVMKQARYVVLDWLPETPEGQNTDFTIRKEAVIQRIDTAIVNKIRHLRELGVDIEQENKLVAEIQSKYTMNVDGKEYLNTAARPAQALKSLRVAKQHWGDSAAQESAKIPVPEFEPKPEDYPNRMGYVLALAKWKQAQVTEALKPTAATQAAPATQDTKEE